MSGYSHQGWVYFITCDQYVKIGYTSRGAVYRLTAIDSERKRGMIHAPADLSETARLRILRVIPGCVMRDERRVQGLFAAHHEVGEWFRLTPAFLLQLARLEYVTDYEVLRNFRTARRELKAQARRIGAAA